MDKMGRLYVAGVAGVHVYNSTTGSRIGSYITGVPTSNVAIGGDGYMYMTAKSMVLRAPIVYSNTYVVNTIAEA